MTTQLTAGARYQASFSALKAKNEAAFIPFVMIGDPDAEQSFEIIKGLIDAGADALELGIPFSDPSADGGTIQKATLRALNAGINIDICLNILAKVRAYAPNMPIGLLLYGNLVFARGIDTFYKDIAAVGVDSVLIADLPIRESERFQVAALKYGVAPIFIAPPNASADTLTQVSNLSCGYTYVLSRAGVTGTETKTEITSTNLAANTLIETLQKQNAAPCIVGFGISKPSQVRDALDAGADGAISGSAVVQIIENNLTDNHAMIVALKGFISDMKSATC